MGMFRIKGRKNWCIKPLLKFERDTDYYLMSLVPTIMFQPWNYRRPGIAVIDITWFHFHIVIGEWKHKEV